MTDNIPVYRIRDKITPAFSVRDARPDIGRGNRKKRVLELDMRMGKRFYRAAGPPGDHHVSAGKQAGNVMPAVETVNQVFPDRKREAALEIRAVLFGEKTRRVGSVRDATPDKFAVIDKKPVLIAGDIRAGYRILFDCGIRRRGGKLEHFESVCGRRTPNKSLVGRNVRRDENNPIKTEIHVQGVGKREMPDVYRIERTAEKGDFHFFLPRFLRLRLTVAPKPPSSSL